MQVGDIVLLKDTDLFVQSWPLARVMEVHPGDDGYVRVATMKSGQKLYRQIMLEESGISPTPEDVQA